ncbi:OmpA family protein [Roseivivax sp. THAF30]|jgi:outer membrane protein OmpA-like peptidoglycan-associated protein|uniref:OmpA family protein n=1 Tax=Roseivivax sp. THAF30 TaxID=2587852 RepID=UPI0012682D90|nr:OmpA family protein [Roseivivax sp. THAF30]QFT61424.1 putative lipoprotein YiaD precursor [Roseivivax sp. THAF30]
MIRAKTSLILSAASLIAITACAPLNDPNNPNRQAQTGALIGAGVGALAGAAAGNDPEERRRNAAAGALIGAAGGAIVGNELDKQEAALRQQIGNNNIDIQNTGDRLIVTLPQNILFATDSTAVSPSIQGDLIAVARNLQQYPDTNVQVIGHTDNTGDASYNQGLSQRRAQAVASILTSNGVPSFRVSSIGRGEDQPVASNLTPEGRAQNRRVEIVILPTT